MNSFVYDATAFSKAGRKKDNQDSILLKELVESKFVIAIADGIGGKENGKVASNIAINVISESVEKNKDTSMESLFKKVKLSLLEKSQESDEFKDMGTTLTVVFINKNKVSLGHVGDCRLYHLRGKGIITQTKDQSEVQKLIDNGIISKQRAVDYHRKNILLSAMTTTSDYELQTNEFSLENNDRLMLLTDGAYSLISKSEIRDISVLHNNISDFLTKLKETIEMRKIKDDYSVVALQIKES